MHLRIQGKLRYLPLHPGTAKVIDGYLKMTGYDGDGQCASITVDSACKMLTGYAAALNINVAGVSQE